MRLGDRIAVMRNGRIIQLGQAEDLYDHPADLFVARMFSEINEVAYPIADGQIETPLGRLQAPDALSQGDNAVVCIRERGIELKPVGQGLPGRVLHVRFLGDIDLLEIGVQGFEAPLRVRTPHYAQWAKGAEVGVEIDAARVLIFPENGDPV